MLYIYKYRLAWHRIINFLYCPILTYIHIHTDDATSPNNIYMYRYEYGEPVWCFYNLYCINSNMHKYIIINCLDQNCLSVPYSRREAQSTGPTRTNDTAILRLHSSTLREDLPRDYEKRTP